MRALAPLLLSLLLHFSVATDTYAPMKIIAINKAGTLHPIFQQDLQNALKWFENAIQVEKLKTPITLKQLTENSVSVEYQGIDEVTVTTPDKTFGFNLQTGETDKLLAAADFVVLITELDRSRNEEAYATMFETEEGERPIAGVMQIKYKVFAAHSDYSSLYHIFRHEILHAMGYGVLNAGTAPPSEDYEWENFDGSKVQATRNFFRYNNEKIRQAVKDHFVCDEDLVGIERDESENHLNEYLFGDELMTPMVSMGENFFSWISAEVVDQLSTAGARPFYKVNRTFIAPEADAYNHFKGTGCELLLGSCHKYVKTLPNTPEPAKTFPFCTTNRELNNDEMWCFLVNTQFGPQLKQYTCDFVHNNGDTADNGVTEPAGSPYHNKVHRFCPIAPIIMNRHFEMTEFEKCMDLSNRIGG